MISMGRFSWRRAGCGLVLIQLSTFLIWPVKAGADLSSADPLVCACCTDEGEWYQRAGKSDLVQLDRVRFAGTANTYQSPASDGELSMAYNLSHTRNGRRWQLRFRDEQGKTGTLSFMIPLSAVFFGADMHDSEPGGLGPLLYKEWRLNGTAQAAGIFKSLVKGPARFHLILQGRGRGCTEAEDFKHWTLQINGAGASYSFYGALNKPE
jgi:hypothetical protein